MYFLEEPIYHLRAEGIACLLPPPPPMLPNTGQGKHQTEDRGHSHHPFLGGGAHLWHMEVPKLGVKLEL